MRKDIHILHFHLDGTNKKKYKINESKNARDDINVRLWRPLHNDTLYLSAVYVAQSESTRYTTRSCF